MERLAPRPELCSLDSLATIVPARAGTVLLVLPGPTSSAASHFAPASARIAREAESLGARPIPGASPWIAFVWQPAAGVTAVPRSER